MRKINLCFILLILFTYQNCNTNISQSQEMYGNKIPIIFDTDANNELDDQHAMAYLLFNGEDFLVEGVTVNATYNGGDIQEQYAEAERILKLADLHGSIPLLKGANGNFSEIKENINQSSFDGSEAVNFIIETVNESPANEIILLAVGKLTNVALALHKEPALADRVKIVWLGSNYPEPGEYNQDNDTVSMNYLLNTNVPFEMVTVRYGKPSGTDAVRATPEEIAQNMPGKGPQVSQAVTGRHGESFNNFGDYSVNLFNHIDLHGDPPSRALYDMAAVAIVKNPEWAESKTIPAPILINNKWVERPENPRKITVWENFDQDKIMQDFYQSMDNYVLVREMN